MKDTLTAIAVLVGTWLLIVICGLVAIPVTSPLSDMPRACASMDESGCPANSIHPHNPFWVEANQ